MSESGRYGCSSAARTRIAPSASGGAGIRAGSGTAGGSSPSTTGASGSARHGTRGIEAEEAADPIVPIVSADFMGSACCRTVELRRAMERHGAGSARVVPIIADRCDFGALPVSRLQALPKAERQDLEPLADRRNENRPLAEFAGRIRELVAERAGGQGDGVGKRKGSQ